MKIEERIKRLEDKVYKLQQNPVVKIVNRSTNQLPDYKNFGDAGMDLRADIIDRDITGDRFRTYVDNPNRVTIIPGGRVIIPTGLFIEMPHWMECQIRPRSGMSAKFGLTVTNSPGTIDAPYRGEIKVILQNTGTENIQIEQGDRICQAVFTRYERVTFQEVESVDELSETTRSEGCFGSTGKA